MSLTCKYDLIIFTRPESHLQVLSLVDQLEFADVILVNKTDIAHKKTVGKVLSLIKTLNPRAKVISTVRCQVDLEDILNTGRFSFEEAVTGAGWLQSKGFIAQSI